MKTNAIRALREKLAADEATYGVWITLEAPSITEMAVALGLDWIVIDAEHGHLDWKEIVEHLRATARSRTVALVRLAELNGGLIKRVLDIGADGFVVPWVESAEQVREAIMWSRFPPEGRRGIGGERATAWGQCLVEHTREANEHVLVVPLLETITAARCAAEIAAVDGFEWCAFGPADFSASVGHRGQWEGPGVADELLRMKDTLRAAGKQCAIIATSIEDIARRRDQGFRLIGLGMDAGLMARQLRTLLTAAGRPAAMNTCFDPLHTLSSDVRRARPPAEARDERIEATAQPGQVPAVELAPGVTLQPLIGGHNHARDLTTGIVTFAPGAALPYHLHPHGESLTVLSGRGQLEVEGRRYRLDPLDNLTIPRGRAHQTSNPSADTPLVAHIAMPTATPSRTLVETKFDVQWMPQESTGVAGAERRSRFRTTRRRLVERAGEVAEQFSAALLPDLRMPAEVTNVEDNPTLEMCGGYAILHPGGQGAAQYCEYDSAVFVISGAVACRTESGRRELAQGMALWVPKGRAFAWQNRTEAPAEWLWVVAGPHPAQVLVDEAFLTS